MKTVSRHTPRKIVGDNVLIALFFGISILEIGAEYFRSVPAIYAFKSMLVPVLAMLYWQTSSAPNRLYLAGLFLCWISNILFVQQAFSWIAIGACFFMCYRIINLYLVLANIKRPGLFPIFIGCIPFFFMYLYLIYIAYDIIGRGLLIFVLQCIIVTILGGISVGNHILQPSRGSVLLLVSTAFFSLTQFIFVFKAYYTSINFQPLAMLFFVLAQYLFYRFMLFVENEKAGSSNPMF